MKKHNKSQFFKAPFSSLSSKNVISNFVFHEKNASPSHKHYENKLRSFLEGIKANKIKYNSLKILFEYEDNFKLICDIYQKYLKSKLELEILNFYLKSLSNFISLIHADEPMEELDKILNTVNKYLRVKQYNKNNILFRIGDYGTNYYILLKGKAYTLIPKKVIKYMTFEEYRNHLNILYIFGEDYLLEQTIHNNSQSLDISYADIENDNNKILRNIYLKYYTCNYEKYIKIINGDEHVMVQNYDLQDDESDNDTKNKEKNDNKEENIKNCNNTKKNYVKKEEENKNDDNNNNIKNEENKKNQKKKKDKYYKILKYFNENFIYKNRTNNIDSIYAQLESLEVSDKNKNISENEDNYSNNSDNDNKRTLKKRLTRRLKYNKIREKNKETIEYFQDNDEIENIDDFHIGIPKQLLTKDIIVNTKAKYDGGELPSFFARDKNKYVYYEVTENNEEENIESNYNKKNNLNPSNEDVNNNPYFNYYNNVLNLKRNLVIVGYDNVTTILSGMSFGELSLLNENHKRTSTIFIEEDSQIGRLNLSEYNSTIKTVRAKIRNDSINFLLSTKLFGDISFLFFMNKYWIYFQCKKAVKGEYLFNIGQKCETIYIIYSGDIKINSYIDKDNIDDMIKAIKSAKIEKKSFLNKIQNNLKKNNSIFEKKQKFCLMIGKKGDILGLNDIVDYHTDKYICEGEIISDYLSYYEINRSILLSQISNNFHSQRNNKSNHSSNHNTENVGNFIKTKEEFMIHKLNDIKNSIEHKVKFLDLIQEKNSSNLDKDIKNRLNSHKKSLSSNHYNIENENLKKTINNLIVSHQTFGKNKNFDKINKSLTLNKSNTITNLKFNNINKLFHSKKSDINSPFNKDKLLNLKNTITINPNLTLDIPSKIKKNKIILNNINSKIDNKQYENNNNSIFDTLKMKNSNFFKPYEYPKIHDDNNSLKSWDITNKIKILKFPFLNNSNKRYFFNQNKKINFINNYFMNTLKSNSKKNNNLININIENSSSSTSKNKYDIINSMYFENEKLNLRTEKNNKGNRDKTYFNNLLSPLNLTIKSERINPNNNKKSNKKFNNEDNNKKIDLKIIIKNSSFNNNQNNNKSSNKNYSNNKKLKNSMSSGKNMPFLGSIKKNYNFSSVKSKKFK